ncbi:MAG: hypothetical protein J6I50_05075 [Clostridia bacterium]|nr:hypothetical protein [Clostridia bacterium]
MSVFRAKRLYCVHVVKYIVRLLFLFLYTVFLFCACDTPVKTQNLGDSTKRSSVGSEHKTVSDDTAIQISDQYFENVYKFQRFNSNTGESVTLYSYQTFADGELTAFCYFPDASDPVRAVYSIEDGTLLRWDTYTSTARGNFNCITDDGHILCAGWDENHKEDGFRIHLCDSDGNVHSRTPKQYSMGNNAIYSDVKAFGEDCYLYYTDKYEMYIFRSLEETPLFVDLPCLVRTIVRMDENTLLLYGAEDYLLNPRFYCLDITTGEYEEYCYSETVQQPKDLFLNPKELLYHNGEFYAHCKDGIYVYRDGAPQLLVNWEESYLDGDAIELCDVLSDDCFVIRYQNDMEQIYDDGLLFRTEERRAKPREVVNLAIVGLDEAHRDLIHTASLQFNRNNEDYIIKLRDYSDEAEKTIPYSGFQNSAKRSAEIAEKAQAAFEADLLSGVPYDGYFLPQTPPVRDQLSEKGLLSDLSGYLEEDALLGCMETAYTTRDGSILALPFFMRLSTLVTSQFVLPTTTRLTRDVLYDMAEAIGDGEALFDTDVYENIKTVGQYDFIDEKAKSCSFDSPEFTEYLDFLSRVKAGAYTDESLELMHRETIANLYSIEQYFTLPSIDALDQIGQNRVKLVAFDLYSVDALAALLLRFKGQKINYCGYPTDSGTAVILSTDALFSMSSSAGCPTGAAVFMQYLLSDEIQTSGKVKNFGLPVSRSALQKVFPKGFLYYRMGYAAMSSINDHWHTSHPDYVPIGYSLEDHIRDETWQKNNHMFTSVFVQKEDCDLFIRFLDRATVKTSSDAALREILDEEISYAESGARSAAQTGEVLQSRVFIYLNE